jgi:hypothetical protein
MEGPEGDVVGPKDGDSAEPTRCIGHGLRRHPSGKANVKQLLRAHPRLLHTGLMRVNKQMHEEVTKYITDRVLVRFKLNSLLHRGVAQTQPFGLQRPRTAFFAHNTSLFTTTFIIST